MGIRRTLSTILGRSGSGTSAADLRRMVEEAVAAQPRSASGDTSELDARLAKLDKKLNMSMGAVQAATAQIMALKKDVEQVLATANQATQHATTAKATAETAVEGIGGIEDQLAALKTQLAALQTDASAKPKRSTAKAAKAPAKRAKKTTAKKTTAKKTTAKKTAAKKTAAKACSVKGCKGTHRARGYCAKHYQQWKRGTL